MHSIKDLYREPDASPHVAMRSHLDAEVSSAKGMPRTLTILEPVTNAEVLGRSLINCVMNRIRAYE